MRKTISYIFIILGIGILYLSTSRTMMGKISSVRNDIDGGPFGTHQTNEGDLVDMAFLDYVPKFHSKLDYYFPKPDYNGPANINLYALGDSYIHMAPDSAYAGVYKYRYAWRYLGGLAYTIDSSKKNILLIEVAERYIRSFLSGQDIRWMVKPEEQTALQLSNRTYHYAKFPIPDNIGDLFNPYIDQNIEYNLFNYNFINPVRDAKAWFNYNVFNRASGNVSVSKNGQQLFLEETTQPKVIESSYSPVSDAEIDSIVDNLNEVYEFYTHNGFAEVYIALIPNPATIIQPVGYNMLIPRIQDHPELKVKVIDIYTLYKQQNKPVYRTGDTHWNGYGHKLWLDAVNAMLIKENTE